MTAKKDPVTGRSWECPKCGFVLKEASAPYSAVSCSRTLKCKHGGGTTMQLQDVVQHSA
jgi:rubrerythrin